jgi:hypothetical protein
VPKESASWFSLLQDWGNNLVAYRREEEWDDQNMVERYSGESHTRAGIAGTRSLVSKINTPQLTCLLSARTRKTSAYENVSKLTLRLVRGTAPYDLRTTIKAAHRECQAEFHICFLFPVNHRFGLSNMKKLIGSFSEIGIFLP